MAIDWGVVAGNTGAGAAGGTVGGPLGSLVGGTAGFISGLTGWDPLGIGGSGQDQSSFDWYEGMQSPDTGRLGYENQNKYNEMAAGAGARQSPGMQVDPAMMEALKKAATGAYPSQAEIQQRQALDSMLAQELALRASGRGSNIGAANRLASRNAMNAKLGIASQQAALRADETARARDAWSTAEMQRAAGQAQMYGDQQARNDAMVQYYITQGYTMDEADRMAKMTMAAKQADLGLQKENIEAGKEAAIIGAVGTGLSSAASAGTAAAVSDVRAKENITKADAKVEQLLDAMEPYEYDYKDSKHGGKKNLGIMAQDLEKSDVGKQIVIDGPLKMVDMKRALMAALASNANLHKRLKAVEGK